MDEAERELFTKGIQHATATAVGADLDAALDELGWQDAFASDPATTVAAVFEHQGAAGTTSSALGVVMAAVIGVELDGSTGVVLPGLGQLGPPMVDGAVRGVGLATLTSQSCALVATGDAAHLVDTAALDLRAVEGMDPRLGLVEVSGAPAPVASLTTTAATFGRAAASTLRMRLVSMRTAPKRANSSCSPALASTASARSVSAATR